MTLEPTPGADPHKQIPISPPPGMSRETKSYKYYAFISYSRKDSKAAAWLQQRLEWFRFPVKLVPEDRRPSDPRYVRRIYRDKTSLEVTDEHYWTNIQRALGESRHLIVLCTPHSAVSDPVNMEVAHFLETHGGDASLIAPVIVSGSVTSTGTDAALCPALRALGDLIIERNLPTMVPDAVTAENDAWESGFVSLASYLLCLDRRSLGDHIQRETKRQARMLRRWLVAVGMLTLIAGVSAWLALKAKQEVEMANSEIVEAELQTRWRASKADTDVALELSARGEDAHALALAVRAIELNGNNQIAAVLAYRLLTDGRLTLPEHLIRHPSIVTALAFSHDGDNLATGCDDGSVFVTALATGEKFSLTNPPGGRVEKLAFRPDGKALAVASVAEVLTWQYALGGDAVTPVLNKFYYSVLDLSWPQADRIVAHSGRSWGSDGRLTQVMGLADQGWRVVFGVGDSLGIAGADFAPTDRNRIVKMNKFHTWVALQSRNLVVLDHETRKLSWLDLNSLNINEPVFSANVAKDKSVFVAEDSGIAVAGNDAWQESAAVAQRGAFEWIDPKTGTRRLVQPEKGSSIDRLSADGQCVLLSTLNGAALVDCSSGKVRVEHFWKNEGAAKLLSLNRDGSSWVLGSRQRARQSSPIIATVLNQSNLRETSLSLPASAAYLDAARSSGQRGGLAEFDRADKWLAVASSDHGVRVWSRAGLNQPAYSLTPVPASTVTTVPNHALGYEFDDRDVGVINRYDAATGQRSVVAQLMVPAEAMDYVERGITGYCFSPDGLRLAVSYGSTSTRPDNNDPSIAILYDTATGRALGLPLHHDDDVFSPCFAPDGRWLVTASDDRTVRRWDALTGVALGEPLRLLSPVRYVQVSPRGDLIATGNGDLIDVAKWIVTRRLSPHPQFAIERAFFSPDGLWLATVSDPFSKTGDSSALDYTALDQWEVSTGNRLAQSIETTQNTEFRWLDPGKTLVSAELVWQCVFPCPIQRVLPLLKACRPMIFDEAGEKTVNPNGALRLVHIDQLFPHGRTADNVPEYELAVSILRQ
jgi:WD40 repeat protein